LGSVTIAANAIKSATINFTPDMLDNTGMQHTAKSRKKGLDDWSLDIELYQEYAASGLDEDLWTLMLAGTTVGAIAIHPITGAKAEGNPYYESTAGIIESYAPIAAGAVGDLATVKLRILAMGATMSRDVTA
jgi:hypothetical protein